MQYVRMQKLPIITYLKNQIITKFIIYSLLSSDICVLRPTFILFFPVHVCQKRFCSIANFQSGFIRSLVKIFANNSFFKVIGNFWVRNLHPNCIKIVTPMDMNIGGATGGTAWDRMGPLLFLVGNAPLTFLPKYRKFK